jgi:anti-anti-sigma regulatory factor
VRVCPGPPPLGTTTEVEVEVEVEVEAGDVTSACEETAVGEGFAVFCGRPRPGVAVVRAVGEIDLITAPGWARALRQACDQLAATTPDPAPGRGPAAGARSRLVCDLSGVEFLGVSGLAVLDRTGEHAGACGVELRLLAATRRVRRILELTGLDRAWPVDARLTDAVTVVDAAPTTGPTTGPAAGTGAGDRR